MAVLGRGNTTYYRKPRCPKCQTEWLLGGHGWDLVEVNRSPDGKRVRILCLECAYVWWSTSKPALGGVLKVAKP